MNSKEPGSNAITYGLEQFSPEQRLLFCCARLNISPAVAADIQALLTLALDWNIVIAYAARHQLTPLLLRALQTTAAISAVPTAVTFTLEQHCKLYSERYELQYRELLRILNTLTAQSIPAIPFKGPILSKHVYGDLSLRPFSDLDFLVRSEDIDSVLQVLRQLGFTYDSARTPRQERFFRRWAGQIGVVSKHEEIWLEPHWLLAQHVFAVDLDYQQLWSRSITLRLDDDQIVSVFAPEDQLLILCVHGYREQWRKIKWLCDIAELVRQNPDLDWQKLLDNARAAGCERLLRLGLQLANILLEAPVPAIGLAAGDPKTAELTDYVVKHLFSSQQQHLSIWHVNSFYFGGRERLYDKLRYLLRTTLAPRPVLFEFVALPDSIFCCYYPIRWLHDYVLLPLRAAGRWLSQNHRC